MYRLSKFVSGEILASTKKLGSPRSITQSSWNSNTKIKLSSVNKLHKPISISPIISCRQFSNQQIEESGKLSSQEYEFGMTIICMY